MRKFLIGGSVAALIILIIVLFTTIFAPRTEAPEVGEVSSSSISESLSSSEISSSVEEQSESIDEPTSESNEESSIEETSAENIVYDYDAYYIIMNDDPNHIYTIEENNRMRSASEPIPVMTNKLGVCDGYAHIYHILSRAVGLEALYVPGPLISDAEVSETHAWNMVNIEGTWVGIDTTWADMGDTAAFRYFHMPLGLFYRDRVTYMDFSSMAQLDYEDMTTDWTWYGQNGYVATADNIFDLVDRMREEQKMAEILLVGLDEGTRLELMEYLDEVMDSDVEYYSLEQDYLYYAHHGDQP